MNNLDVQAAVIVDTSRKDKEYLLWKEQCFDSLRENNIDICQSAHYTGNTIKSRQESLRKISAPFVAIVDPDDYIGSGYAECMLNHPNVDTNILYPAEILVTETEKNPAYYSVLQPSIKNLTRIKPLGHHPFGKTSIIKEIFDACPPNVMDTILFKDHAIKLGYQFSPQFEAKYFWRQHPSQLSKKYK